MTVHVRSKAPEARRFGGALKRAMRERGVTVRVLSAETGVCTGSLVQYRNGWTMPIPRIVSALSDALVWPELVDLGIRVRETTCGDCGRMFIASKVRAVRPMRYCSKACGGRARNRRAKDVYQERVVVAERELETLREAVRRFCESCEDDGICRNAMAVADEDCVFLPVTPFLIAGVRRAA